MLDKDYGSAQIDTASRLWSNIVAFQHLLLKLVVEDCDLI